MKSHSAGFAPLIAIIALLLISGGSYLVLKNNPAAAPDLKLKTFSSENYPKQFNFFHFQYPEGWDPYYISDDRVYIVKQDGPIKKIATRTDIEDIPNTYIELRMSGDRYSEEALRKYFQIKSIKHKTIGDKGVLVWIVPASLEDAERGEIREYSLNYTIATKYTGKDSVTFMLRYKADQKPHTGDIQALESMVRTFEVTDSTAPKKLGDVPSANAQFSKEEATRAIALSFEQYKAAILAKNGELAIQYLDHQTINHYHKLRLIALTWDKDMLQKESILDQISILLIRDRFSRAELNKAVDGRDVLKLAIDKGMIGENSVRGLTIGTTGIDTDKKTGYIQVKYSDGAISPVKIISRLEENQWKIDLTSMFPIAESAIRKDIEKSGLTAEKFIVNMVSKTLGKPMPDELWVAMEK